jgi:hypothetical protein
MASKSLRSVLLVFMDGLFILAVIDVARLVVRFFGELGGSEVGVQLVRLTEWLVIPFGMDVVRSPYGGVFDWNAALTVGILIVIEVVLGLVRRRS